MNGVIDAVNSAFYNFLVRWPLPASEEVQRLLDLSASLETQDMEGSPDSVQPRQVYIEGSLEDPSEPYSPLFALIVGINSYQWTKIDKLRGGVADAQDFRWYLLNDLKVPETHIRFLSNEMATRANIIENLKSIESDDRIQHGDAILIFFAGHGAQAVPPQGSKEDLRVFEVLVTHDLGPKTPGIPDRELRKILDDIAKKKGNNITVVMDSCHSASATRELQKLPEGTLARAINSETVDYDLHNEICKRIVWTDTDNDLGKSVDAVSAMSVKGLRSHVLLAACQSYEVALESDSRGHFSTALLKLLRSKGLDTTYSDLLEDIENVMPKDHGLKLRQNPQCLGHYQGRFIFNQKVSAPRKRKIPVEMKQGRLTIKAGAGEGISDGDQFIVYDANDHDLSQMLGTLTVVEQPLSAWSLVKFQPLLQEMSSCPSPAVAVQSRVGKRIPINLYVRSDPTDPIESLVEDLRNNLDNIRIVHGESEARIAMQLSHDSQEVLFHILPQEIAGHQFRPQSHLVPRNRVVHVLQEVVEYYWHLERGSQQIADSVEVEFFQLILDVESGSDLCPIGSNLIDEQHMVKIAVRPDDLYGIKLTNKSGTENLYPYLYYFDGTNLSIDSYFKSPPPAVGGRQVESPLKAGGNLTLGYGSGGVDPLTYHLPEGQDVDLGTLKIFLFTEPIDQQAIPTLSPFQPEEVRGQITRPQPKRLRWGTITIPIIQYRS